MTIDDGFRKLLDGVKLADEGRDQIMHGLEEAWRGRKDLDGQIGGLESQVGDLRETIDELKRMIIAQGEQITALRDTLNNRTGGAL